MRFTMIAVAAGMLVGCAPHYMAPAEPTSQLSRDEAECRAFAETNVRSRLRVGRYTRLLDDCMEARGYQRQ
jgi:hypothetical protein